MVVAMTKIAGCIEWYSIRLFHYNTLQNMLFFFNYLNTKCQDSGPLRYLIILQIAILKGQTVVKRQRKHFSLLMLNKISITSEVFENFSTLYLLYLRGWSLNIDIIENFLGIGTVFVECTFIDYFIQESYK